MATNYIFELNTGTRGARGLSAYQIAVNEGFEGTEEEWMESLEASVTAPNTLAAMEAMSPEQEADARAAIEAASDKVTLLDRFGRYADATGFDHNTRTPEVSPFGNWRMHFNGGVPTKPTIEDGALRGGTNTLYYLGGPVGEEIKSFAVVVEWRKSVTYPSGTSTNAPFVIGLGPSTMLDADGGEITLPENMIHLETIYSGIKSLSIGEGGAVFDGIIPEGASTTEVPWDNTNAFGGMAFNRRYVIYGEIDEANHEIRVTTPLGQVWKYTDERIGASGPYTDIYIEAIGDSRDGSPLDRYCVVHEVRVNAPQIDRAPGRGVMPYSDALAGLAGIGRAQLGCDRADFLGIAGTVVPSNVFTGTERVSAYGDFFAYLANFVSIPVAAAGRCPAPVVFQTVTSLLPSSASSSNAVICPLYDFNLPADGSKLVWEIEGTFGANGNTKRIRLNTVAPGVWFDSGNITESGTGFKLTVSFTRVTGTARRMCAEFVRSSGTTITPSSHNVSAAFATELQVTGTAAGDVTITSLVGTYYPARS